MSKTPEEIKSLCQEVKAIMARKFPGHDHGEDVDLSVIWDALDNAESHASQEQGAQSTQQGGEGLTDKRRIRIMRNALDTIQSESTQPIIQVYAQSALDETIDAPVQVESNAACKQHNWYGKQNENCPLCTPSSVEKAASDTGKGEDRELPSWVTDGSGPVKE